MSDPRYWTCQIGPVDFGELPMGGDWQPRHAAIDAVEDMVGREVEHCWSGWGDTQPLPAHGGPDPAKQARREALLEAHKAANDLAAQGCTASDLVAELQRMADEPRGET